MLHHKLHMIVSEMFNNYVIFLKVLCIHTYHTIRDALIGPRFFHVFTKICQCFLQNGVILFVSYCKEQGENPCN